MGSSAPRVSEYLNLSAPASLTARAYSISLSGSVREPSSAFTPIDTAPYSLASLIEAHTSFNTSSHDLFPRNLLRSMTSDVDIERLTCFRSGQFLKVSLTSAGIALHHPSRRSLLIAPIFASSRLAFI